MSVSHTENSLLLHELKSATFTESLLCQATITIAIAIPIPYHHGEARPSPAILLRKPDLTPRFVELFMKMEIEKQKGYLAPTCPYEHLGQIPFFFIFIFLY